MLLTNQNICNLKFPEPHQPGGTARVTFTLIAESIGLDPHPVSQELQCLTEFSPGLSRISKGACIWTWISSASPRCRPLSMQNAAANMPSTRPDIGDSCLYDIITDLAHHCHCANSAELDGDPLSDPRLLSHWGPWCASLFVMGNILL